MISDRQRIQAHSQRLEEELADLKSTGVSFSGTIPSPLCVVKGTPNAAELSGAEPLSGPDGEALLKSFDALGYLPNSACALLTVHVSAAHTSCPLPPELVRLALEVLDSPTLVLADKAAAHAVQEAYGLTEPLADGDLVHVQGRRVLCLGGFEDSLDDPQQKQVMWARLKRLPPEQAPY